MACEMLALAIPRIEDKRVAALKIRVRAGKPHACAARGLSRGLKRNNLDLALRPSCWRQHHPGELQRRCSGSPVSYTHLYSRGGAIDAPEKETYCTQFEGCFLFVLRTNSLTECPAGVTVELLTSTGETLHGANTAPLPRNGTLQMEVDWPPVDSTAVLNSVTCK